MTNSCTGGMGSPPTTPITSGPRRARSSRAASQPARYAAWCGRMRIAATFPGRPSTMWRGASKSAKRGVRKPLGDLRQGLGEPEVGDHQVVVLLGEQREGADQVLAAVGRDDASPAAGPLGGLREGLAEEVAARAVARDEHHVRRLGLGRPPRRRLRVARRPRAGGRTTSDHRTIRAGRRMGRAYDDAGRRRDPLARARGARAPGSGRRRCRAGRPPAPPAPGAGPAGDAAELGPPALQATG